MELRSGLVDWYRDVTSVLYGLFLIALLPRTDNHFRYCTNTGSISLKFYIPDQLKHLKCLNDELTRTVYSQSVPIFFPQMQKSFPSVPPKRAYQVSLQKHSKSVQRKPARLKETSSDNFSKRISIVFSKTTLGSNKETLWHPRNG